MRRELQANNVYALDTTKLKISRNESLENHHVIIFYLIFQYENHGLTDKKVLKTYINACKLCLVLEDAVLVQTSATSSHTFSILIIEQTEKDTFLII